ncbi:NFX1-type zinc finger-containing protein 1-like isoform X1 [Ostrinia furnacalis]|uniref:NFX1-type zinc finger-containing protein 1-like isoform X1 n=1 Tax=Ostrinia furnacalis TaxID=93504 RepID=UPI00103F8D26|nr:NFX1-type zinc finger-containing protein 1-like isoform X1 [Ostrinia furnacalis]XP_028173496.1 NFX1-type zinc finger-containing protein 1-like isoform X1 [Ostrinia furnacalis]XP_028173497.1 NFX1-type zinc finger-containing protein 1-like isoform X1 [Ostrinia furnacalis]
MDDGQLDPDTGPRLQGQPYRPPQMRDRGRGRGRGFGRGHHNHGPPNNNDRMRDAQQRQQPSLLQRIAQADLGNINRNRGHASNARPNQDYLNQQNNRNYDNMNNWQRNRRPNNNTRVMGFKTLEEIAMADPVDIIAKINERKESFDNLITKTVDADVFVLTVQVLAKISMSSFDELKLRILLDVCHSQFVMYLRDYLINLPYSDEHTRRRNRFYWNNQDDFWNNLITFCECIVKKVPSIALQKLRSLIEGTSKSCLENLKERHGFILSERNNKRLLDLRESLTTVEKNKEEEKKGTKEIAQDGHADEPPEDFRQLSVIPTREDLLDKPAFVRANVVRGGYRDVDHYLDVQFRLLREDCFGPLRDGLMQYTNDPNQKRYDNIRVYRNVKFIGPYISATKAGMMIQLDESTVKKQKRINWAYSKRFIFGSLLLFTKDNCATFIVATILDRDVKCLSEGKIPISIVENRNLLTTDNINKTDDPYVMIESEVYFEPYLHVLKALQDPNFAQHVAMSKYVVKVDPIPYPPKYLQLKDSIYEVETQLSLSTKFRVLQENTWPTQEDLGLNESQYEAYKLALTHEFAVIQGPPGTGKTYLGVKVAQTLLENLQTDRRFCLMLVICYTNHALDQFLEHILKVTDSIVRIGGQSKNEAMEKISLNNLRRTKKPCQATNLFQNEKRNLKLIMSKLLGAQKQIDSLSNGILTFGSMSEYVPEVEQLRIYYEGHRNRTDNDVLMNWLFENATCDDDNAVILEKIFQENEVFVNTPANFEEEMNERTETIFDDLLKEIDINGVDVKTSFMLNDAELKIQQWKQMYKVTENIQLRQRLEIDMCNIYRLKTVFMEMRERYRVRGVPRTVRPGENLRVLSNLDRWSVYFTWANTAINQIRELIAPLHAEMEAASVAYEEARMNLDLVMLRGVKVVGMTTSGAARLRKLLTALAPPIVIVEEAAEVLEQHIVTSLTKDCEHLILIGDHQQLRPSAAYMKLAKHYDIEVSLFERMIWNNMHSRRLSVQHRMRPEIAALISPHIYPDLANHPSVEAFPHVRGITANMFFYSHNFKEEAVDDSSSRSNQKEADLTLGVANYLMQQGYEPEDVTILSAYSGQMFYMRKQRGKYAFLNKVKITVVDNYQGEESKIILLSLVRNNDENRIGFLGTENRICVALSRAKEGFYIFGNIDILKANSPLWTKIATTLEKNGLLGTSLKLKCENHPDQITTISTEKDFEKVPEGGCRLMCNKNLPECGHRCPRICHAYDRGHTDVHCSLDCERIICELGHVCPLKCAVKCRPCKQPVVKTLPCGHKQTVHCHLEPNDPAVKCNTTVTVQLPNCGHEAKKPCHMDIKKVQCLVPCEARVQKCGHQCRRTCHVTDDPEHEKYICVKPCAKSKKGCTANLVGDLGDHQCLKLCHEPCDNCNVEVNKKRSKCKHSDRVACCKDVDEDACKKKCARVLPCLHFCKKKCYEKCGDCDQKVKKVIPECGHTVEVECRVEVTREMCREACQRQLSCGHACRGRCDQPCDAKKCTEIIPKQFNSLCGHKVALPCNVWQTSVKDGKVDSKLVLEHCNAPCTSELACGHACAGSCARCRQGRLHAPCTQRCHVDIICGHQCEEPCNQVCPPCKKRCEVRCPHTRCAGVCGAPCVPCKEKCKRQCRHGACENLCGDPCSRPPCDEPCGKLLKCRHPCRGLCGEPCPDICKICRPDEFPTDFLGDDFDDDAKFIQLQDCSHIMAVEDADNLMQGDKETITIRACPFCRKPIINTYRYKDLVNEMYRTEINPIKERVYGTQENVKNKQRELIGALSAFKITHVKHCSDNEHFQKALNRLEIVIKKQSKKISLVQLEMHFLYLNLMGVIGEKINKYTEINKNHPQIFQQEFDEHIKILCEMLIANIQKISQQQQQDIHNEIKRANSILQLCKIYNHDGYKTVKHDPKVVNAATTANTIVFTWKVYEESAVIAALLKLQEAVKLSDIVKKEREMIVRAVGLRQGHWFKCPNGHFYCIGECGGAMQVGKCIECGAQIGGQSHRLLSDNRLAREMDEASYAAWSDTANNMANFDLNVL